MKDKPHSLQLCTSITPQNEEHLNQLIHMNEQMMTRKLYVDFNALETVVAMLEYCEVCTSWVCCMRSEGNEVGCRRSEGNEV